MNDFHYLSLPTRGFIVLNHMFLSLFTLFCVCIFTQISLTQYHTQTQNMPTDDWGDREIEILLSSAFVLSTLFGGSEAHLNVVRH